MGHATKIPGNRCNVLDELEAAITLKKLVKVYFEDGSTRSGKPLDLNTRDHEDFLELKDHLPIPISRIVRVEKV